VDANARYSADTLPSGDGVTVPQTSRRCAAAPASMEWVPIRVVGVRAFEPIAWEGEPALLIRSLYDKLSLGS
jgi:hypothetical protein